MTQFAVCLTCGGLLHYPPIAGCANPSHRARHDVTNQPMTLTDFLLARIAEDEAAAREVQHYMPDGGRIEIHLSRREGDETRSKVVRPYDPARVLAECEAKRRIMGHPPYSWADGADSNDGVREWERVVQLLALPYADHPDYREEWKP